jgi:cytochrome c biogenesis protein CcmG, thiol:disulfide interchange protein DsbE
MPLRLVAIALALLALACQGKSGDDGTGTTATSRGLGTAAPALVGKTLEGEPFALEDLRGQVVLVNVWATWCAPCRHELPELRRLYHAHRERGLAVVGVSVDARRALGALRGMVEEFELDYPMVFDPEQRAIAPWGIRGYPTSVLVDRQGIVRWRRDGMIQVDDDELAAALSAALAGA